jgi:hypothetical protein
MKSTAPASRRPRAWAAMIGAVALIPLALGALVVSQPTQPAGASSHREAPFISSDPEADNTDLYAFVSPDMTNTVTIVANYIPLEEPNGGPNFASFGDNVLYEIRVDNTGNGEADVVYQFRFNTQLRNPNTFLYNTGPITSLDSANWNMPQFYSVTRLEGNTSQVLGANLKTPPVNVGPRSTPNYDTLASAAINSIGGRKFFAGQRDDPFFVDLGSIFDLGGLRPFNSLHLIPLANTAGVDGLKGFNTHSIVMQVPITDLTRDHQPPGRARAAARRLSEQLWAVGADLPARQPPDQRSRHSARPEGLLERHVPVGRQAVRQPLPQSGTHRSGESPLSRAR